VLQVQLEQCTFQNNTGGMPNLLADNSGIYATAATVPEFYSDDTTLAVCVLEDDRTTSTTTEPACNRTEPVKGLNTVSTPFLSLNDPAFVTLQQVGIRLDFKRYISSSCTAFLWCMHSFPDQCTPCKTFLMLQNKPETNFLCAFLFLD
jgi:hypothetical protein